MLHHMPEPVRNDLPWENIRIRLTGMFYRYKSVAQGNVGLVTKFGRFARAVDPGLIKIGKPHPSQVHRVSC